MAESAVDPNNRLVVFRGRKERERMPVESKAQNAAMHAAAAGKSTLGIPKSVGKKFVAETPKGSVKKLPQHVKQKAKGLRARGLISDKAAAKMEA